MSVNTAVYFMVGLGVLNLAATGVLVYSVHSAKKSAAEGIEEAKKQGNKALSKVKAALDAIDL